jgi:hypothetical protein
MMIKGGIRIGGLSKIGGLDADAVAYFERAGVTDATAKSQISAFVIGVKALGLYNNMVCWPFRSTQNKGSGTTAYSLGGLQTSNATLTGAGWTSDGVSFSGSTQYITSDLTNIPKDVTLFVSAKGNGSTYNAYPYVAGIFNPTYYYISGISIGNAPSASQVRFGVAQPSGYGEAPSVENGLSGASSFVALCGSYKRNSVFNMKNLSNSTATTQATYLADEVTTITKMVINGRWESVSATLGNPMTSSFFAIITPNCDSIISSFHSLYKTTLGTGLGLP